VLTRPDPDPAILEACHRPHAHVEDRIRAWRWATDLVTAFARLRSLPPLLTPEQATLPGCEFAFATP
jgi:hypothetical protein